MRRHDHLRKARRVLKSMSMIGPVKVSRVYVNLAAALYAGAKIDTRIVASGLTDEDAFDREVQEIKKRSGLWNVSQGGKGMSVASSEAARRHLPKVMGMDLVRRNAAIANAHRDLAANCPEYSARRSADQRRAWADQSSRARRIETMVAYRRTPETIKAKIMAASGHTPQSLGEYCALIPNVDRTSIKKTLHKLSKSGDLTRCGPKRASRYTCIAREKRD